MHFSCVALIQLRELIFYICKSEKNSLSSRGRLSLLPLNPSAESRPKHRGVGSTAHVHARERCGPARDKKRRAFVCARGKTGKGQRGHRLHGDFENREPVKTLNSKNS